MLLFMEADELSKVWGTAHVSIMIWNKSREKKMSIKMNVGVWNGGIIIINGYV